MSPGLRLAEFFKAMTTIGLPSSVEDPSNNITPKLVSLVSVGGTHTLSLINPPISITRNNNLVFDLSDSSLSGLDFKIYYD